MPYELVSLGGFTPLVDGLIAALCRTRSAADAARVLERHGATLWRTAVERALGTRWMGTIERYDDRPLYWSRLIGTRDLRQWRPSFALSDAARAGLIRTYEYASRGISSATFPRAVTRVLVSGFDPDQLNNEIRRSNPSGASALQLDGVSYRVGERTVRIEAVALPVTWSAFDAGYVEDAFGPALPRLDLMMTIGGSRPDPARVVCRDDGPTPGSQAQQGGGGNYLSNESMYRSNRLRLALGATDVPGGHLHISALVYPADPLVLIDRPFAADRAQTIEQTVALVKAAGAAVR